MTTKKPREPLTEREVMEAVEELFGPSVPIEAAATVQADDPRLAPYVQRILHANDIDDAWVSDESFMGDFIQDWGITPREQEAQRKRVAERLGIDFGFHDRVIDVAQRLLVQEEGS